MRTILATILTAALLTVAAPAVAGGTDGIRQPVAHGGGSVPIVRGGRSTGAALSDVRRTMLPLRARGRRNAPHRPVGRWGAVLPGGWQNVRR